MLEHFKSNFTNRLESFSHCKFCHFYKTHSFLFLPLCISFLLTHLSSLSHCPRYLSLRGFGACVFALYFSLPFSATSGDIYFIDPFRFIPSSFFLKLCPFVSAMSDEPNSSGNLQPKTSSDKDEDELTQLLDDALKDFKESVFCYIGNELIKTISQ